MAAKKYVFAGMTQSDRGRDTRPIRPADLGSRTDSCDLELAYVSNSVGPSARGSYFPLGEDYAERVAVCVEAYHLLGSRDDAGESG